MARPSLRGLAQRLGMSRTTVSEALRGVSRVGEDTRRRVLQAAGELGYRRNLLAGALMAELRRSRAGGFRGSLALVDWSAAEDRSADADRYNRMLADGAKKRADECGFRVEKCERGRFDTVFELNRELRERDVRGVLLLPMRRADDPVDLDWSRFAGIYADYAARDQGLHVICPDHYRAMLTALDHLRDLGYRRPGLVLDADLDERLSHQWEAACFSYPYDRYGMARIAPLVGRRIDRARFASWLESAGCDVVLAHRQEVRAWMEAGGARVPATHGFCCLNVAKVPDGRVAGLDLQPALVGRGAVDLLVGQILRNECGVAGLPTTTTVPPKWVPGPTLRRLA